MKQSSLDLNLSARANPQARVPAQMERVVPWAALVELIAPYYREVKNGRLPFALEAMLRTTACSNGFACRIWPWRSLSLTRLYREFDQLDAHRRLPHKRTILRFRHRLEKHNMADQILATVNALLRERGLLLKEGSAVDTTWIAAPSASKNKDKARDWSTPSGWSNASLATAWWCATWGLWRTRCSLRRCLRYQTCGWGAPSIAGNAGMGAPENRNRLQKHFQQPERRRNTVPG